MNIPYDSMMISRGIPSSVLHFCGSSEHLGLLYISARFVFLACHLVSPPVITRVILLILNIDCVNCAVLYPVTGHRDGRAGRFWEFPFPGKRWSQRL